MEEFTPQQERYRAYTEKYKDADLRELISSFAQVQKRKQEMEDALKEVNAEYDVLRINLIPSKMEDEGIERVTITGIGRVSLTSDMYVHVTDQEKFFKWLEDNGLDSLIKETVPPSTLKAFVKERVKAAKELPTEALNIRPFTRASITKV